MKEWKIVCQLSARKQQMTLLNVSLSVLHQVGSLL